MKAKPAQAASVPLKSETNTHEGASARPATRGRPAAPVELWIGFDFGTSCSKIVVRPMYQADSRAFVVPTPNHARADGDCLWVTRVWLDASGRFSLRKVSGAVRLIGIKEALMGLDAPRTRVGKTVHGNDFHPRESATAYLALLFREAREWFVGRHGVRFAGRPLRWSGNVGFPAASYDNEALCARYRRIVAAAWKLAESGETIDIGTVRAALAQHWSVVAQRSRKELQEVGADVVPEVVAEAHGFAQSPMRDDGLYLLLDVGASTLDVCTFVLHRDEQGLNRYSILDANVEWLGAEICRTKVSTRLDQENFAKKVKTAITETIWQTRKCRDPHSPRWRSRLPFLICGGGSRAKIYQSVLNQLDTWFHRQLPDCRLEKIDISSPRDLEVLGQPDYRRLAVAFGLSYPGFEIGGIELPRAIEDVKPMPPLDYEDRYVSKDMV